MQTERRIIGYVRVSTADQAEEGVSLAEQENRIRAYAVAHGLQLAGIEADEGVSGKATGNRPGLLRALQGLRGRRAAGLVVVKLDRLSRSLRDALDLVARSEKEGWQLHSIGESLDTRTPHGRFVVHLFAALAQLEREQIGERTKAGMAELRRRRSRISRYPPFGHRFSHNRVVVDEEESRLLRQMIEFQNRGAGPTLVAWMMNDAGCPNPRTGRPWTLGNVHAILKTALSSEGPGHSDPQSRSGQM